MYKTLMFAGLSGAIAVLLGALGAHALKDVITSEQLVSYKTGNTYHMFHSIALLAIGLLAKNEHKLIKTTIILFVCGIIFFSGSIYLLATKDILGIENWKWLGPITPLGGLFFITGWVLIAIYGAKRK